MIQTLIQSTIAGIAAFVATNLDDLLVLMLFFSQVDRGFRRRQIVAGQYLGFIVLLLTSLPGFFGGFLIPAAYVGLLGILPIAIGLSALRQPDAAEEMKTVSAAVPPALARIFSPQTYQVAAVTIANGGDNIGIYLPLFASRHGIELGVILTVFLILVGIWCAIANSFAQHQLMARLLMQQGNRAVPFVLISLGLYILWESKTYTLLRLLQN